MIAFGRFASMSPNGIVDGTISEKTRHSRTRRAISCAYCAPKSTTRTVSNPSGLVVTEPEFTGRAGPGGAHLAVDPATDHIDDVPLLLAGELDAGSDVVPLGQAGAATCRGGMLRDENRVPAVGRLLPVFDRMGRREALRDQLPGVQAYDVRPAQLRDRTVAPGEVEPGAERLPGQPVQPGIDVIALHYTTVAKLTLRRRVTTSAASAPSRPASAMEGSSSPSTPPPNPAAGGRNDGTEKARTDPCRGMTKGQSPAASSALMISEAASERRVVTDSPLIDTPGPSTGPRFVGSEIFDSTSAGIVRVYSLCFVSTAKLTRSDTIVWIGDSRSALSPATRSCVARIK